MNRLAQIDFFQPLCELFEDKLQLNPEGMELINYSTVPSLCEMCLRKIRTIPTIGNLLYTYIIYEWYYYYSSIQSPLSVVITD